MPIKKTNSIVNNADGSIGLLLNNGMVAVIDADSYDLVKNHCWSSHKAASGKMYARTNINRRGVYLHRVILGLSGSQKPIVDHRDGDGLNNRHNNIRACSQAQNLANSRKMENTKGSKYKGVAPTQNGKWRAKIFSSGKHLHIGTFDSELEAAKAYDAATLSLRKEFALLNFPVPEGGESEIPDFPSFKHEMACQHCGRMFLALKAGMIFCSKKCCGTFNARLRRKRRQAVAE